MKEDDVHMAIGKEIELKMYDGTFKKVTVYPLSIRQARKFIPLTFRFTDLDPKEKDPVKRLEMTKKIFSQEDVIGIISELIESMLVEAKVENPEKVGMLNFTVLMDALFELNPLSVEKDYSAIQQMKEDVRHNLESASKV